MVLVWGKTKFKWNNTVYRPTHIFMICLWSTLDLWKKCHWNTVEEQCFHLTCLGAQSCLILCEPIDCSPSGSSVYGIFQARILDWVVISSSRGSYQSRDQTCVSYISCMGRRGPDPPWAARATWLSRVWRWTTERAAQAPGAWGRGRWKGHLAEWIPVLAPQPK